MTSNNEPTLPMSDRTNEVTSAWWADKLEDLDVEIARLAVLCKIPLLKAGVMQRVLEKDATVCGARNEHAFTKLHSLLMVHLVVRTHTVGDVGESQTAAIESYVVERLKARFGDQLGA